MKVLLFPLISTIALVSAQQVIFRSADPEYYADYGVDVNTNPENPDLYMQLSLNNFDVTNITKLDGTQGFFMGIGFGSNQF
jgi:hypothetical protein